tara:strand:+ start:239 stop:469 length:231 start_codon:yes stop_codon:yes gene_type:complete
MARDKKEIIELLAYKYDLSEEEIEMIVDHQFKFIAKVIKEGDFNTVRIPYLGKFIVNEKRVEHINRLKRIKDNKNK